MRFFAALLLPLLLLALPLSEPSLLHAANSSSASITRQIQNFEALRRDENRSKRRDLWLAQEKNFADLAAKSSGENAAKAALYQARCRQELGDRSFLASDHRQAAALFAQVADAYAKYPPARESLYRQGQELKKLGDADGAQKALERLIRSYPSSKEAAEAKKLIASLAAASSASRPETKKGKSSGGGQEERPLSVIEQLGLEVKTIMLDPGHGGKDPGADHNGIMERRFTLAMARRVASLLEKKGFTVLHTRTADRYISLQDRPDMANRKKADLFVSIHVNANAKSSIRGLEVYYLDEAKSDDAVTVAARENAVSVKNISDLQFILTDLMLGSKLKESHKLADCVHRGILAQLKSAKLPAHSNGVRSAPFYVLMGARMPAILVEFGYITNADDAANLKKEAFLQRQAEGLVEGILRYKAELAKMAPN